MKQQLLTSQGVWDKGILLVRVMTGLIILHYGLELFNPSKMSGYQQWLTDIHFPMPLGMARLGKATELAGGGLLMIGLFTRLISIPLIITMSVVTFIMGKGNIFADEQLPFLLMLLCLVFLSAGAGIWSLDYLLFDKKRNRL
jgi:putative oxidoreductase